MRASGLGYGLGMSFRFRVSLVEHTGEEHNTPGIENSTVDTMPTVI